MSHSAVGAPQDQQVGVYYASPDRAVPHPIWLRFDNHLFVCTIDNAEFKHETYAGLIKALDQWAATRSTVWQKVLVIEYETDDNGNHTQTIGHRMWLGHKPARGSYGVGDQWMLSIREDINARETSAMLLGIHKSFVLPYFSPEMAIWAYSEETEALLERADSIAYRLTHLEIASVDKLDLTLQWLRRVVDAGYFPYPAPPQSPSSSPK